MATTAKPPSRISSAVEETALGRSGTPNIPGPSTIAALAERDRARSSGQDETTLTGR
ncbi:hypothetical protein [Streptomyces canus]|uniref:hypothetical protein n=1 Tax=Streptomyces canus TaxID=58343 RepID=UPI0036DFD6A1